MMSANHLLEKIKKTAIGEVESKFWGITQQFLEIHNIVTVDGKPKIDHVDQDKSNGEVIVYFPVERQKFHLAISVETVPDIAVTAVCIEPYSSVYFCAGSESIALNEMIAMTNIRPTTVYKKGMLRPKSTSPYKENILMIEPNPGPDEFQDKIQSLLDLLESDKKGVGALIENAGGYIQVAMEFHNGNSMLGGANLSSKAISRMADMKLGIDFDLYARGNSYK